MSAQRLKRSEEDEIIAKALAILTKRNAPKRKFNNPDNTRAYLRLSIGEARNEMFGIMFLDTQHGVIKDEVLFTGTIDGTPVYPRVVVQKALEYNAAAVILYHNHPSGVAEPSMTDAAITKRLIEALKLIDVRTLDHFVVSGGESVSMAERGLM